MLYIYIHKYMSQMRYQIYTCAPYCKYNTPNYRRLTQLFLAVAPFTVCANMHFMVHEVSVNNF